MKKIVSLFLVLYICFSMFFPVFAIENVGSYPQPPVESGYSYYTIVLKAGNTLCYISPTTTNLTVLSTGNLVINNTKRYILTDGLWVKQSDTVTTVSTGYSDVTNYYYTNYDILNYDGSVFFSVPLISIPTQLPLQQQLPSLLQLPLQYLIAVVGSVVGAIVLFLGLRTCITWLFSFLRQLVKR